MLPYRSWPDRHTSPEANDDPNPDTVIDSNETTLVNTGLKGTRGEPIYLPPNKKPSHTAAARNGYHKKCKAPISFKKRHTEEDIKGLYKEMGYLSATLDELLHKLGLEAAEPWPRPYTYPQERSKDPLPSTK